MARLAALEIGEENEPALIVTFQQDGADQGTLIGARCGQAHGVRLDDFGVHGLLKPEGKLVERAWLEGGPGRFELAVFSLGRSGLQLCLPGGIMGSGVIAQGGQFFIQLRQILTGHHGKFTFIKQFRDFLQALCTRLLPIAGLFLQAFQPFGQLRDAPGAV